MIDMPDVDRTYDEEIVVAIAPMRPELIESYWQVLDVVARERKYLAFTQAPPIEESRRFVLDLLAERSPMVVAFTPGPRVVGWCDIRVPPFDCVRHVGVLGMGVHPDFRGEGIGHLLLERALRHARTCRLEKVELTVFASNLIAVKLYEQSGFEVEGIKRRSYKLDGVYDDVLMMARYF